MSRREMARPRPQSTSITSITPSVTQITAAINIGRTSACLAIRIGRGRPISPPWRQPTHDRVIHPRPAHRAAKSAMALRSDNGIHRISTCRPANPADRADRGAQGVRRRADQGRDKVVAVEGADLTVADGELFAILGPSGSGKTTVLRMIAGFEQPTVGRHQARRRGRDRPAPGAPRHQHRLPAVRAVSAHDGRAERRIRPAGARRAPRPSVAGARGEALEMVRLSGHAARKPAQLSGGQQQRVALARALVGRPKGAAARRAARRARPQAARADAGRAQGDSARGRDHLRHRHPRSGRGADAVRSARGVQRRPHRADRRAPARSTSIRPTASSPTSSAPPTCSTGADAEARARPGRHVRGAPRTHPGALDPGQAPHRPGCARVDATVAEVVYAGPTTRIAARNAGGCRTDRHRCSAPRPPATSSTAHPSMLAWPDSAVRDLNTRPEEQQ